MKYNILVPTLENSGPNNLALEIAKQAQFQGYDVEILFLGEGRNSSPDVELFTCTKFDLFSSTKLRGILHTHGLRPDIVGAFVRIINNKVTSVTTIHNHFFDDLKYLHNLLVVRLAFIIWAFALKFLDFRFCISESMRGYYKELLPNLEMELAYNFSSGVSSEEVSCQTRSWISSMRKSDRVICLFAGSLIDRKNVVSLAKSFGSSRRLSLLICGDGPLRRDVEELANRNCNIFLVGETKGIRNHLDLADVLVLPSFAEGFPMVVLEAASVGLVSFLSDIPVHREIQSLGLGCVVNFEAVESFEHEICDFVDDIDLRRERESSVLSTYDQVYSPESGFMRYQNALKRV